MSESGPYKYESQGQYRMSTEEKALRLSRQGRADEAIAMLTSVISAYETTFSSMTTLETWSSRLSLLQSLGNIQEASGQINQAISTYMKIITLATDPRHQGSQTTTVAGLLEMIAEQVACHSPQHIDRLMFMTPSQAKYCKNLVFPPFGKLPLVQMFVGRTIGRSSSMSGTTSESGSKYESESDSIFSGQSPLSSRLSVDSSSAGSSLGPNSDASISAKAPSWTKKPDSPLYSLTSHLDTHSLYTTAASSTVSPHADIAPEISSSDEMSEVDLPQYLGSGSRQLSRLDLSSESSSSPNAMANAGSAGAKRQKLDLQQNPHRSDVVVHPEHAVMHSKEEDRISLVVSNCMLNIGKILHDSLNAGTPDIRYYPGRPITDIIEVLWLYVLSMSLSPSASAANNIGVILAELACIPTISNPKAPLSRELIIQLAYDYYAYGLTLDQMHPHLCTNFGSLLREHGKLQEAKNMYAQAIHADRKFAIALSNLALCFQEEGEHSKAVTCYKKAVRLSPNLTDPLVGMIHCQSVVCDWKGRGGFGWEKLSVDARGNIVKGTFEGSMAKLSRAVDNQLQLATRWGIGVIQSDGIRLFEEIRRALGDDEQLWPSWIPPRHIWSTWQDLPGEGANVLRLVELTLRATQRRWYIDLQNGIEREPSAYIRPKLPSTLPIPQSMSVLPFHAFILPLSEPQVRGISERTADRIATAILAATKEVDHVYPPPAPPENGILKVGYISSDFADHPLSHLMQSVFGLHDRRKVLPYCYALSLSDSSQFRNKIERESHVFKDVSACTVDEIASNISRDGIHILVNLNGFTKGGRNEIFALRPCPIQVSMMGFAGPMGATWCDYLFGDVSATPSDTSVYQREKIVFMPDSFFCNDHLQSNPDSFAVLGLHPSEARSRDTARFYRDKLFPHVPKDAFIMANFNQLYKIEPTTFLIWLRILERLPNSYLWLLRFPKSGEANLLSFAKRWTGPDSTVISRILFTDVVDKPQHLSRCHASDLFLDTPECNAHTTAVDVLWAGTPIVTYPRHVHKLCSRIATSVIKAACTMYPDNLSDYSIAERLITHSEREYEERVVHFGSAGRGELEAIRRYLLMNRERSALFNTARWVSYLETAYEKLWSQWCNGTCDNVTVERKTG